MLSETFFTVKGKFAKVVPVSMMKVVGSSAVDVINSVCVSPCRWLDMACSQYLRAKRASVKVLLALAQIYDLTLGLNRDSPDDLVQKAYHKLVCFVGRARRRGATARQHVEEARSTARAEVARGEERGFKRKFLSTGDG